MTTENLSVTDRVCLAKAEVGAVPKNGYNPHGKYQHATVDDIYASLRPILAKHKLDLSLDIVSVDMKESGKGTMWMHAQAKLGFVGEDPVTRFISMPMTGPQSAEILNSYLIKQYLRARFQLETGDYEEQDLTRDNPPANPPSNPPVSASITDEQRMDLETVIEETGIDKKKFCEWLGVSSLNDIRVADHERALDGIRKKREEIAAGVDQQKAA